MKTPEPSCQENQGQIIRMDARNCFVEVKSDCFHLGKIHFQFVAYDTSKPSGQRYTNNIHIYIDIPEFLVLAQEAANGSLHMRMRQIKAQKKSEPLYEHLGGTSAKRLASYGKARADGKSLSRILKLTPAEKADYFLTADCGPGEENKTGLIVPRFGKNPEQHVSVILTWRQLDGLLFTTAFHYQAWLSAKYLVKEERAESSPKTAGAQVQSPPAIQAKSNQKPALSSGFNSAFGSVYGSGNGKAAADDMRMF